MYTFTMQMAITIKRRFPEFLKILSHVSDNRKRPVYKVEELLMAVISLFLFKRGSRNHADNTASKGNYSRNFERLFQCKLPDLDTCDRLLKTLDTQELEEIKRKMIQLLLRAKVLDKYKLFGMYHLIGIDATGLHSYDYEPYPECPYKTSKSGKRTWTAYVLEAKILCSNGFSFSMATEWVKNPVGLEYEKQDCELKAFKRLSQKIKQMYPRLPMVLAADGLYPNDNVFKTCKSNGWRFIITLKDGNLPSVWEEVNLLKKTAAPIIIKTYDTIGQNKTVTQYCFLNSIEYKTHTINFLETKITSQAVSTKNDTKISQERFVHITDIGITNKNSKTISDYGRMRWKIENEGFNEQKNSGYNLGHKYSRKSFNATQNYYQCLQIAHMINQLAYKTQYVNNMIGSHDTIKSYEECIFIIMIGYDLDYFQSPNLNAQMRY
ncbi:MAG: hypothetical protein Q7V19_17320 [Bacteroidales bacterium]|jgi:hypothetical protein|nr:hypothetical protein [Bacteroidales bacterium]MDP2236888.1 hypothetical protein [Bacteroidales bacterium]